MEVCFNIFPTGLLGYKKLKSSSPNESNTGSGESKVVTETCTQLPGKKRVFNSTAFIKGSFNIISAQMFQELLVCLAFSKL